MFKLIKIEGARMNVPEPEYLIAGAALSAGQTVSLSGGKLVVNTTAPTHITLGSAKAADEKVPCARIESNQVYEAPISEAPASLNVGDKVTVASDGARVTATTADGIATIVSLEDAKASGDKVTVRF